MADEPLHPDDRLQAQLLHARNEKDRKIAEAATRITAERGDDIKKQVEIQTEFRVDVSPEVQKAAVPEVAKVIAERGGSPNFDFANHRDAIDKGIERAQAAVAEQQKAAATLEAERQKQEQEKQAAAQKEQAAHEAARQEPIPGTMRRFNAMLAESKAQKETHHTVNVDRASAFSSTFETGRPVSPRLDKDADRTASKGEISDAKMERLTRLFNKPLSDKTFDATHDPGNAQNFAKSRGGRDGR